MGAAQTPELVVTATRVPTPVLDIPAGVSVIDRQTIEQRGYLSLTDALAAIPGVRVSQSGGPGGNASVFVRGSNSNHVLVLRDGMPLNDASDSSGAFNFGVDTLADVERIEVIRGPMAALYGSGAIGGVINLISRQGREPGLHLSGELAGGFPAQGEGNVNASGIEGPVDYSATFQSQILQGFDATPRRMSIYTGVPDGYRELIGTLNLGYTPVEGTRLSLFLRARRAIFGFDALGAPTFDNSNSTGHDDSFLGRVGVTSKLFDGIYETSAFVGRLNTARRYTEALNPVDNQSNDSRYYGYRTDVQWNNTVHLSDLIGAAPLSATDFTFGYEHIDDTINVKVNQSFSGFPFQQAARASMTTDAVYSGLQTTLWQRLTLMGQIRQDWVAGNTPFTWRLGAVLDVSEIATRLKAAYGTAFRAPSLFDRFGIDSFGYVGNPNLKPESAQGWELGFTTTVDAVSFGATYFNQQVENLIVAQFAPVNTAMNIGSAHIQGVETELTLRPAGWLALTASYTFTDAQDADQKSRLLRRPQNSAAVNATITPLPGLTIAPELLLTGAFRDFLVDNAGTATAAVINSPHGLIANLTITYDVEPRVQLFAITRNLFNSRFEPVNGYQTPGASVLAGVRVRL
ncbi:MAG: TonB-dependent receptor [Acetobacteraceae bacterium]